MILFARRTDICVWGEASAVHPRSRTASGTCLNSVENQLVIYRINEVMDARHGIIPLPGLKQDDGLDEMHK